MSGKDAAKPTAKEESIRLGVAKVWWLVKVRGDVILGERGASERKWQSC
jgi:hypothetical protein